MGKVKRTTVNLDTELVGEAREILGTRTTTDTVHTAMREIVRRERLQRLAERKFEWLTPARLEAMRRGAKPSEL